jgi:hypothetical protein
MIDAHLLLAPIGSNLHIEWTLGKMAIKMTFALQALAFQLRQI